MNIETFLNNYAAKIIGFSMIVCNSLFLLQNIKLFYEYHFTNILFCLMIPNTVLFISAILFSIGIGIGILVFKDKINYLKWSLIDLGIIVLVFLIENLLVM